MPKNNKRLDDFFKKSNEEPEELKKYYEDLNKGVDPNKQTVTDRVAYFFKNLAARVGVYYKRNKKEEVVSEKPSTFRRRIRVYYKLIAKKISDLFNFEAGVDILDDTSVLFRRNKVNRNILLVINVVFFLLSMIGNQQSFYLVIAFISFIMVSISRTLKRIINEEPRTLLKQQMAMYIGSIYILLASMALYAKLRLSAGNISLADAIGAGDSGLIFNYMTDISISQAGYVLIYFALIVVSLYQDATLLRVLFRWVFVVMFGIHVLVLYPLASLEGITGLYNYLFIDHVNVTIDILLRTVILVVFYIALYSNVTIGEMLHNKRKEELIKRREMEKDFTAVVGDVFDVIGVFNSHTITQSTDDVHRVAELASRLANILGLSSNICTEIYEYSVIHIDKVNDLSILEYEGKETLTERDYAVIREKTILGSVVIKRLQLNQKSEDIVRVHFEKTVDQNFTEKMKRVQRSQEGQVILLAEIYDILRQERNYKSELKHKRAVDLLQLEFKEYFEPYILDRFLKYQLEFEAFYEKYKYSE